MTLHVVFRLAGNEYALPVDAVLQMETFSGATFVPGAPSYVAGIVTVRGLIVPVIDVRARFGLPPAALTLDSRIIVSECAGRVVALLVDSAREVLKLDLEKHQPAPGIVAEQASGFVHSVHSLGQRLLLLVDLPKILGETSHEHAPRSRLGDGSETPQLPG